LASEINAFRPKCNCINDGSGTAAGIFQGLKKTSARCGVNPQRAEEIESDGAKRPKRRLKRPSTKGNGRQAPGRDPLTVSLFIF
ncbi:MAG: hypothetical protein QNI97_05465, partial [Desulfobacterales bacterium]|nr:hypothetical protein [Desulfobacterales bacterium]